MKINFELEKKDILAFYIYSLLKNKSLWILYSICFLLQVFNSFAPLVQWIVFYDAFRTVERDLIFYVVLESIASFLFNISVGIGFFAAFYGIFLAVQMLRYRYNDGSLGNHLIELRENNLLEATDVNETAHSWKSVQKIVEWRKYILIYVSPTNAHFIPKRSFSSDAEARLFIEEAKRLKELSKTNFSPSYLASNS